MDKILLVLKGAPYGNQNARKLSEWQPTGDYSKVPDDLKAMGYDQKGYALEMTNKERTAWAKTQIESNAAKHSFTKSPVTGAYFLHFKGVNGHEVTASVGYDPSEKKFRSGGTHKFPTPMGGNSIGLKSDFFDTVDDAFEHAKANVARITEDDRNERR